ncbi:MAG: DUF481 domain-containing protein [bacterium]
MPCFPLKSNVPPVHLITSIIKSFTSLSCAASGIIWKILEDLTFKEIADYSFSFEDMDKYFINSETAMEMQMNNYISFGISYLIAYQNTPPSSEVKPADRTFLVSLIIDY